MINLNKNILLILLIPFILTSCFVSKEEDKSTDVSIDKSTPEKVILGYAKYMEKCDINTAINYFDPITAEVFKKGLTGMIQGTFDMMNNFSDAVGVSEGEKNKLKQGQEQISNTLKATGIDKIDYNKICKESDLYIKDFKQLDSGKITLNSAVYKVSYTLQGEKITEDWKVIKNGEIWDLTDDGDNSDQTIEKEIKNEESGDLKNEVDNISQTIEKDVDSEKETKEETLSTIKSGEFSSDQKDQIRYGKESGIDTSIYENDKFSVDQMKEIRYGLESKVDAKIYANPNFSVDQMKEIRYGLESGIDANSYAKVELSVDEMKNMRYKLEDEKN